MRRTARLAEVAAALLEEPYGRHWGYKLMRSSGVRAGVLYPMLTRMLEEGWVTDGWEDRAQIAEKRPPRRYYELTDLGRRELAAAVRTAQIAETARPAIPRPEWA
jgi:PadR family transcriptional regulator, regulatory protein PadR